MMTIAQIMEKSSMRPKAGTVSRQSEPLWNIR